MAHLLKRDLKIGQELAKHVFYSFSGFLSRKQKSLF